MTRIISIAFVLALSLSFLPSFLNAAEVPSAPSAGHAEVAISSTVFPDDGFLQFILESGYDQDSDMKLSADELDAVSEMDCGGIRNNGSAIRDLTGIGNFRNLTRLICRSNLLSELDVSGLPKLTYLDCSSNRINTLDVSGNAVLETLFCRDNGMTFLDVSECYCLGTLECGENSLTELDISNCPQLDTLSCQSNSLSTLDVTTTPLIRNYILTTPRVEDGTHIAYGEYVMAGDSSYGEHVTTAYHVEMDPETAPYSNDTGRNLDTGINADPFLITTIIVAYMLTGRFAKEKKDERSEN